MKQSKVSPQEWTVFFLAYLCIDEVAGREAAIRFCFMIIMDDLGGSWSMIGHSLSNG
ncbi:MAG: hypothetical protein KZQ88_00570 [Candidatus Thiodiazotropha sp. (ex Dulcina madagascariensis)]|nr:hypothetical protein [Candidatus Thiodiazotropha sp. (ex Epidulcina cf. delphinae)]MCU7921176.1 hypothetical protein [Candidatus Thiodiazotropha sp. (ex Dulcina madagascariensis)]MCU7925775.1 hypothetical protein [Candidatus Thiodiazotropha sp. (ex Dulcina madagascariensis)]